MAARVGPVLAAGLFMPRAGHCEAPIAPHPMRLVVDANGDLRAGLLRSEGRHARSARARGLARHHAAKLQPMLPSQQVRPQAWAPAVATDALLLSVSGQPPPPPLPQPGAAAPATTPATAGTPPTLPPPSTTGAAASAPRASTSGAAASAAGGSSGAAGQSTGAAGTTPRAAGSSASTTGPRAGARAPCANATAGGMCVGPVDKSFLQKYRRVLRTGVLMVAVGALASLALSTQERRGKVANKPVLFTARMLGIYVMGDLLFMSLPRVGYLYAGCWWNSINGLSAAPTLAIACVPDVFELLGWPKPFAATGAHMSAVMIASSGASGISVAVFFGEPVCARRFFWL
eukprot:CAMPEP_0175648262 /NCGR_PEP_ID=MMETSP0097-20121207/8243_1 /TAXON_ID=311494 /ORGANISM="Alexandrium monilatum, Strain CCMP3105" /LENGTH=344 /DNA_ID=CAMNT_0016954179 /DNA_START=103 /DNA_END=1134 /DNA_ORIENTATION=-